MELNKFHQKTFADFCGGVIDDHHGAVWQVANSLTFVGAFVGDFEGDFFARQKLVAER